MPKYQPIADMIDTAIPTAFEESAFKSVIENMLPEIRNHHMNTVIELTAIEKEEYKGNLSGFLASKKVPYGSHWIIMRVNGMDSIFDFKDIDYLIIPNEEKIRNIREIYQTIHRR